jgi:hypothetical protein
VHYQRSSRVPLVLVQLGSLRSLPARRRSLSSTLVGRGRPPGSLILYPSVFVFALFSSLSPRSSCPRFREAHKALPVVLVSGLFSRLRTPLPRYPVQTHRECIRRRRQLVSSVHISRGMPQGSPQDLAHIFLLSFVSHHRPILILEHALSPHHLLLQSSHARPGLPPSSPCDPNGLRYVLRLSVKHRYLTREWTSP